MTQEKQPNLIGMAKADVNNYSTDNPFKDLSKKSFKRINENHLVNKSFDVNSGTKSERLIGSENHKSFG